LQWLIVDMCIIGSIFLRNKYFLLPSLTLLETYTLCSVLSQYALNITWTAYTIPFKICHLARLITSCDLNIIIMVECWFDDGMLWLTITKVYNLVAGFCVCIHNISSVSYQLTSRKNVTLDFWQLKSLIQCTLASIRQVHYIE